MPKVFYRGAKTLASREPTYWAYNRKDAEKYARLRKGKVFAAHLTPKKSMIGPDSEIARQLGIYDKWIKARTSSREEGYKKANALIHNAARKAGADAIVYDEQVIVLNPRIIHLISPEQKNPILNLKTPYRITFYSWPKASKFAQQQQQAGYAVDICGGLHEHGQRHKYIVTVLGRAAKGYKLKTMSPYFSAYTGETSTQIVNRMERENRKPLRSKSLIEQLASKALKKHKIEGIKVSVKRISDDDGYTDAETRWFQQQKGGPKVFSELIFHPIHQYTRREVLDNAIRHEIGHIRQFGHVYIDSRGERLSRRPHRGWKRLY